MSKPKFSLQENNDSQPKAAQGKAPLVKSRLVPLAVLAMAALLAAGGAYLYTGGAASPLSAALSPAPAQAQADGVLTHNLADFADGKAKHFSYQAPDGITVKYFVIKSSDGVVRAAFDACDVCWRAGKGYSQSGDYMVCNNCGRRFASVQVNEVKGGCNPAPLARTVQGDKLVIKVSDILEGRGYFNFKQSR
ncbi:MAG: Fe-S-containing protein [Thermodesulfobacteriota bacterium]